MKKISLLLLLGSVATVSFAQDIDKILNAKEVERIERTLSSDAMEGRATFSPGIDKAAAFIADEFKKAGLQTWNNSGTFLQKIPNMISGKPSSISVTIDGAPFDAKNVMVLSGKSAVKINENSGLEKVTIPKGANLNMELRKYTTGTKSYLVVLDTSFAATFSRMQSAGGRPSMQSDRTTVIVLTATDPQKFSVEASFAELSLQNVLGVLPGKSLKNEYVIFSGHYDHLGIRGGKDKDGNPVKDSIYNGANDDAAGTTAVIMLAKYFKALNNNERTLVFCAFTGEEVGGYGASYFSKQFKPEDVKAMFNIEMIGTESKWGTNSAYITGYERTDMGKLLQGNLDGTGFTFYPDPYPTQQLFFRSDNATLARLGVPAHTISTSKMDSEPNYHKVSDEIGTLDMDNMARIIKAIALSSKGIVSGKETPSRVDVSDLKR
ncbi:M20/M25/M40 family metallo-hydrolase [Sediminibacterium roseum]|uniref:M20/M25/M40 family metallo-hydrolase n=1 Tax=Sediminibacterium roseum TaxID=1978412 RepID=A0ABW9ZWP2_9BACT|nr:M28 family peptidase [Sediminibacterium roseum]NCI51565.1 M20/M25/M40 family metallo-hydrolase [Sediminibacterium roseum]